MNTISGIDGLSAAGESSETPFRNALSRLPMIPAVSPEKHSEYPTANQMIVVQPIDTKLCIMIASTFLRPTSPP